MPIPRWVTRSNRRFLNPVVLRVATGVGPMAVVRHVGRRSGREDRTPGVACGSRDGPPGRRRGPAPRPAERRPVLEPWTLREQPAGYPERIVDHAVERKVSLDDFERARRA